MVATYNPTLESDLDWVRFLIGDRDVNNAKLDDGEINAALTEEANKYLAAARCGDVILTRGQGVVSKAVGDLSITYGDSVESAYRKHISDLRKKGAEVVNAKTGSKFFRTLG